MGGRRWTPLTFGLLGAMTLLAILAGWQVWADIFGRGLTRDEDSHVLLAVPVAIWLVWQRRRRLRTWRPAPSFVGPMIVAAGVAFEFVGFAQAFDIFRHFGAILLVVGAIVTVIGTGPIRDMKPALIALLFVMPVPGRFRQMIAIPLQEISAKVTEYGLGIFGMPIARTGNLLIINGHEVAIAEACNGMRMVSALALIAFTFAFSVPMRNSLRVLILALSPAIALLVNIIRLVPTTLMYGYADTETADLFHDLSGWAVLLVALGILWGFLGLLRWLEVPITPYPVARQSSSP